MRKFMLVLCLASLPLYAQQSPVKTGHKGLRAATERTTKALMELYDLQAILQDAQTNATISPASWKTVGNEAYRLADRLYHVRTTGNPTAHAAARQMFQHVREMRDAALKGDAAGARSHAAQALPFAEKILEAPTGPGPKWR